MAYLDETGLAYYDGKLKEWIEGPSSDIAHRTGNESIAGEKRFSTDITNPSGAKSSRIVIESPSLVKGTVPAVRHYCSVAFVANGGDYSAPEDRLGAVEYESPRTNHADSSTNLSCYNFNSTDTAIVRVGFDANMNAFSTAVETSDARNDSKDIVTRGWRITEAEIDDLSA